MADRLPLYVCVGTRSRFENWCHETFECSAHHAESTHMAIGLHTKYEMKKLYGYHGPMELVDLGDSAYGLSDYARQVIDQENYLELLRLEAQ